MLVADGADDDVCAVGMSDAIIGDGETFAPDDNLQLPCRPHAISPHPPLLPHRRAKILGACPLSFSPLPSLPSPISFPSPFNLSPPLFSRSPLRSRRLKYSQGVWGSVVSSPAGFGAEPQRKANSVHFSLKTLHLVASNLLIFPSTCQELRVNLAA